MSQDRNPFLRPFPIHPEVPADWDTEQDSVFEGPPVKTRVKCTGEITRKGVPGICGHWASVTWGGRAFCRFHNPYHAQVFDWIEAESLTSDARWAYQEYAKYQKETDALKREIGQLGLQLIEARADKMKRERMLDRLEVLLERLDKLLAGPSTAPFRM